MSITSRVNAPLPPILTLTCGRPIYSLDTHNSLRHTLHDNSLKRRADSRVTPEREAMYLRALTLDMKDSPEDPRPAFYYAATLLGAGHPQEAMEAYEHYFGLSENREPARRAVAFRDAATVAGQLGNPILRRTLLFRSLEHDWRSVHTYLALADLASENNNASWNRMKVSRRIGKIGPG